MTGWGWAIILAQLVGIVWLTMAWADSRRELREYRRTVSRMTRYAQTREWDALQGDQSATGRALRSIRGGDAS